MKSKEVIEAISKMLNYGQKLSGAVSKDLTNEQWQLVKTHLPKPPDGMTAKSSTASCESCAPGHLGKTCRVDTHPVKPVIAVSMFKVVLSGIPKVGFDPEEYSIYSLFEKPQILSRFYDNVDDKGCEATMQISIKKEFANSGKFETIAKYFFNKYLRPTELKPFLKSLVTIELNNFMGIRSTNCE